MTSTSNLVVLVGATLLSVVAAILTRGFIILVVRDGQVDCSYLVIAGNPILMGICREGNNDTKAQEKCIPHANKVWKECIHLTEREMTAFLECSREVGVKLPCWMMDMSTTIPREPDDCVKAFTREQLLEIFDEAEKKCKAQCIMKKLDLLDGNELASGKELAHLVTDLIAKKHNKEKDTEMEKLIDECVEEQVIEVTKNRTEITEETRCKASWEGAECIFEALAPPIWICLTEQCTIHGDA